MTSIKKIICALDLSDLNPAVPQYAISLAEAYGAEIIALYASPPLTQYAAFEIQPKAIEMFAGEISAGAEKNMDKVTAEFFTGVKAQTKVLVGAPADIILEAAAEEGADIIVMGTHGRRGYDRFLLGSVAEKVVMRARVPVLTVPHMEK